VIHKAFKWFFAPSKKPITQTDWTIICRLAEMEEKYLCLLMDVKRLEEENIETTNTLYEVMNSIEAVDARIDILVEHCRDNQNV
jgi:hypothetical protein